MINENTNSINPTALLPADEAFGLAIKEVENAIAKAPRVVRQYTAHLLSSRGKYIRASSLITCGQNEEGLVHPNTVKLAAAVEVLHLATLVHDDVIDDADLRRGEMTLQKKYGKRTAVICGDYLLCTSLVLAASISEKEKYLNLTLPDYAGKICAGELEQHINNFNLDLSIYQYLKIISGKTAALFETSFYAGAVLAGYDRKVCNRYRRLGFYVGMIFQLTDDLMDFESTKEISLKPVQSDYEQGVITLPLIHTLKNMADFRQKAEKKDITRQEINTAVKHSGGLVFTKQIVDKYYKKAIKVINELSLDSVKKAKLTEVLNKASRLG